MSGKTARYVILAVLAAGFLAGVAHLFALRFDRGDVYPEYSSLRSDPMGTRVFYEALGRLGGVRVSRNMEPLYRYGPEHPVTLVVAGARPDALHSEVFLREAERLAVSGCRVVVAFRPSRWLPVAPESDAANVFREKDAVKGGEPEEADDSGGEDSCGEAAGEEAADGGGAEPEESPYLGRDWGVSLVLRPATRSRIAWLENGEAGLLGRIDWWGPLRFADVSGPWQEVYALGEGPVVLERRLGPGSIVLMAGTYPLSNEGLSRHLDPRLLAWIAGSSGRVVFDETHLGVLEEPGTAALLLKYRLHGLFAGLVLCAVLFAWKSSVRFLPEHEASGEAVERVETAPDMARGMTSLLRRGIAQKELPGLLVEEWVRTTPLPPGEAARKAEKMRAVLAEKPAGDKSGPVRTYNRMSGIVKHG